MKLFWMVLQISDDNSHLLARLDPFGFTHAVPFQGDIMEADRIVYANDETATEANLKRVIRLSDVLSIGVPRVAIFKKVIPFRVDP